MKGSVTKRLLATAVAAACALTTAACSGFDGGTGTPPPKDALCPGKKAPKNVTVVNFWQTFAQKALLKSAQDFNCAHPDIAINFSIDQAIADDNNGKLLASVSAHKPPDLVLSYDDVIAGWAAKGELTPLDDAAASAQINAADYQQAPWQGTNWAGKQYGIPVDWDPDALLWYNKKVFADAGLDPNKPPTTWDDLQSYAAKIDKVEGGTIKRIGFVPSSGWAYNYIQLAHQYGAELEPGSLPAGNGTPRVVVDSPGMRKAFDYEVSVYNRLGGFDKAAAFVSSNGSPTAPDPLMSGRVGMFLQGDWQLGQQAAFGADKFRETVGVVAMPTPPGGQQYLCHSGWAYSVPAGSKHAKEAMEYVAWMEQPEHFAAYLGETLGWLPARKETLSQSYITSDPTWQKILEIQNQTGTGAWLPASPILAQYYRALDTAESSALSHKQSTEQALQTAQKEVDDALKTAIGNHVYQP